VEWLPFLLRSNIPFDGHPKGGTPESRVSERLKAVGEQAGINFTGLTDRYPNSVKAHALLEHVFLKKGSDAQHRLMEVLFRHYFTDGLYPHEKNLLKAAGEIGLSESEKKAALSFITSPDELVAVRDKARRHSAMGISGVPYFFLNGKGLGSGAQPPETLVSAMRGALRQR